MNIKFNEVTWYSKLLAVILFVAVAVLFFYFGAQNIIIENGLDGSSPAFYYSTSSGDPFKDGYESAVKEYDNGFAMCRSDLSFWKNEYANLHELKFPMLNFKCDTGKKFSAQYGESSYSPAPGAINIPHYELRIYFTEDNFVYLSEISHTSDVAQYSSYDKKTFFQTEFDKAFIKQNGIITYKNCFIVE